MRRAPDEIVGDPDKPHALRWVLLRRKRFQIVVHKWLRSDDTVLHDHSWWNVSIRLRGDAREYNNEERTLDLLGSIYRGQPMKRVTFRRATDKHFIFLVTPTMWTIFITGPHVREWGYWIRGRFVPWKNYLTREGRR